VLKEEQVRTGQTAPGTPAVKPEALQLKPAAGELLLPPLAGWHAPNQLLELEAGHQPHVGPTARLQ
jgi:hypothetical protein